MRTVRCDYSIWPWHSLSSTPFHRLLLSRIFQQPTPLTAAAEIHHLAVTIAFQDLHNHGALHVALS